MQEDTKSCFQHQTKIAVKIIFSLYKRRMPAKIKHVS